MRWWIRTPRVGCGTVLRNSRMPERLSLDDGRRGQGEPRQVGTGWTNEAVFILDGSCLAEQRGRSRTLFTRATMSSIDHVAFCAGAFFESPFVAVSGTEHVGRADLGFTEENAVHAIPIHGLLSRVQRSVAFWGKAVPLSLRTS